jgi:hypothetical protein
MSSTDKDPVSAVVDHLSKKAVAWNYLVVPHANEQTGTLMAPGGEPVWLEHQKLPWADLANRLQAKLVAANLPDNIKVFVGDEAFDLHDINSLDCNCKKDPDYEVGRAAGGCIKNSTFEDFEDGLFKGPGRYQSLHLNKKDMLGVRSPVSAYFVSFQFKNIDQAGDYIADLTSLIFGIAHRMGWSSRNSDDLECPMPDDLKDWLASNVGAEYGQAHSIIPLRAIFNTAHK